MPIDRVKFSDDRSRYREFTGDSIYPDWKRCAVNDIQPDSGFAVVTVAINIDSLALTSNSNPYALAKACF
jgi:hypothetical protein